MKATKNQIQNLLDQMEQKWRVHYNPLIFEAQFLQNGSKLALFCRVLTQKQRRTLRTSLLAFPELDFRIQLLSESQPLALIRVSEIADVFSSPTPPQKLMSQILPREGPCRLLDYPITEGFRLVELPDKTLGWVEDHRLQKTAPPPRPLWEYLPPASLRHLSSDQGLELLQTARSHLGIPYKLGGRSALGMDCSALTQAILRNSLGILLPRHSGDQRKLGLRVTSRELRRGDLLFGRKKNRKIFHVAMMTGKNALIHSCMDRGKVTEEHIEQFREKYQVIGARRLFDSPLKGVSL